MKGIKRLVGFLLIPCLAGCMTIPGDFSIKSSSSESKIYVDGTYEGKGSAHLTTLDEDLNVRIETPDHDDLTAKILPEYISDKNLPGMQASQGRILLGFLIGVPFFVTGAIVAGLIPDEDAPNYETYQREVGRIVPLFMSIGALGGGVGVLGFIDSRKEKPVWKTRYSYNVHPLAHYDDQGFHKETGFDKFGVNRQGVFEDGSRFTGQIDRGVKIGYGTWISPEGDEYTGNFISDMLTGFGLCRSADGSEYYGYWDRGIKAGLGILYDPEGPAFLQEWRNGTLVTSEPHNARITGSRYDWLFLSNTNRNGLADGSGDAITKDGQVRIADGTFSNGRLIEGTMIFQNGTVYEGRFDGDLLREGMIRKQNGQVYEGTLRNGIPSGQGTLRKMDGSRYTGIFENGTPQGEGEIIFPNGDSYQGPFVDGMPHGKGMYRFRNGDVERCEFFEGKRIDEVYKMRLELARAEEQRRQARLAAEEQRRRDEEEEALRREEEERRRDKEDEVFEVQRNEWAVNSLNAIDETGNSLIAEAKSSAPTSSSSWEDDDREDDWDSESYEPSDSTADRTANRYDRTQIPEAPRVNRSDYSFKAPEVLSHTISKLFSTDIDTGKFTAGGRRSRDEAIENAKSKARDALRRQTRDTGFKYRDSGIVYSRIGTYKETSNAYGDEWFASLHAEVEASRESDVGN